MSEVDRKEAIRAEQEAKLERMLLEGLQGGFSPWTKEDVENIKRRALARIKEMAAPKGGPDPTKPANEKDN